MFNPHWLFNRVLKLINLRIRCWLDYILNPIIHFYFNMISSSVIIFFLLGMNLSKVLCVFIIIFLFIYILLDQSFIVSPYSW